MKSNLFKTASRLLEILQTLIKIVHERGGDDEDILQLLTDNGKRLLGQFTGVLLGCAEITPRMPKAIVWDGRHCQARLQALLDIPDGEQDFLKQVAAKHSDLEVAEAAIARIEDMDFLIGLLFSHPFRPFIREAIIVRLDPDAMVRVVCRIFEQMFEQWLPGQIFKFYRDLLLPAWKANPTFQPAVIEFLSRLEAKHQAWADTTDLTTHRQMYENHLPDFGNDDAAQKIWLRILNHRTWPTSMGETILRTKLTRASLESLWTPGRTDGLSGAARDILRDTHWRR
ncbi:hypothetical protein HY523_00030 [Candidatus Berkelbacteria bacterium]|nr:hypothetical protein [Candidatus Berkelbacteria bacterium]